MKPIRFSEHHRSELSRIGLPAVAIDQLEAEGLPRARRILQRQPRRADVLHELRSLRAALVKARDGVERLLQADWMAPARLAALRSLKGEGQRNVMGGLWLHRSAESLGLAIQALEEAIQPVPRGKPLRHKTASSLPVEVIFNAVQFGSIRCGLAPVLPGLEPSVSASSAFRRLIGICYEAIGAKNTDPERAIKEYVQRWRSLDAIAAAADARTERDEET